MTQIVDTPIAEDSGSDIIAVTRRWFTEGWAGNIALADETFGAAFATNGTVVGPSGPKINIKARLVGFPDLSTDIRDVVAAGDKVVIHVVWKGTHTGSYGGVPATGRAVEVRVISIWRFEAGKAVENWTIQDQFTLLQQIGYLPPNLSSAQVRSSTPHHL